ncbi:MAG: hypothetical protein P8N43_16635 [Alphaproteobacteria bacterium]|nr:hypothetical protein [Alphaproteobacteria bacterium]
MTRTVTEQAMRLLAKSVSDIAGEERRIADALMTTLRSDEMIFAAPVHFGLHDMAPMTRHGMHGQTAAMATNSTVH